MSELSDPVQDSRPPSAPELMLRRLFGLAAAVVMFSMMLVTFVDVAGRYLFSSPLPGGFEITEVLLAALIFLGLPLVTAENGHVNVDLLDSMTPAWFKRIQLWAIGLINVLAFGTLSWLLWEFALRTYEYQDTTSVLQFPLAILIILMAVCSTLATLILAVMLFTGRERLFTPENEYSS